MGGHGFDCRLQQQYLHRLDRRVPKARGGETKQILLDSHERRATGARCGVIASVGGMGAEKDCGRRCVGRDQLYESREKMRTGEAPGIVPHYQPFSLTLNIRKITQAHSP